MSLCVQDGARGRNVQCRNEDRDQTTAGTSPKVDETSTRSMRADKETKETGQEATSEKSGRSSVLRCDRKRSRLGASMGQERLLIDRGHMIVVDVQYGWSSLCVWSRQYRILFNVLVLLCYCCDENWLNIKLEYRCGSCLHAICRSQPPLELLRQSSNLIWLILREEVCQLLVKPCNIFLAIARASCPVYGQVNWELSGS